MRGTACYCYADIQSWFIVIEKCDSTLNALCTCSMGLHIPCLGEARVNTYSASLLRTRLASHTSSSTGRPSSAVPTKKVA